jgi:uncharacterized protein
MTALMNAVTSNDANKVRELIAQGVNIDEADASGDSPLIMAAYKGYAEIVRLLLEAGADVSVVDPGMQATALHAAAYAGRTEAAKLLIDYHIDINKQGPKNGYTALHDAIWQNNIDTARVIIDGGANLHLKSHSGQTPLEFAQTRNQREIVVMIQQKMGGA